MCEILNSFMLFGSRAQISFFWSRERGLAESYCIVKSVAVIEQGRVFNNTFNMPSTFYLLEGMSIYRLVQCYTASFDSFRMHRLHTSMASMICRESVVTLCGPIDYLMYNTQYSSA